MDDKFSGKLCVITGAGSGIGRALARALAAKGARLALSDVNEEGLAETVRLIGAPASNSIRTDRLDVSDAGAVEAYAASVKESLGDADYLFNVAGMTRLGDFNETSLENFEKVMNVNFWGVVRLTKAFLPQLLATKGGVINISSLFGLIGFRGQTHYSASKFAVRGFSETLAIELEEKGVAVTSVHPGGVATNIVRNAGLDSLPEGVEDKAAFDDAFDKMAITPAEKAADLILAGAAKGKRRVIVGSDAKFVSAIQRLFPQSYAKILKKLRRED
ncbi:SDR family NAD(P)-dependent oxidoreductase [Hyphococcus luteus]|uniref:Acetoin dehydrogenase n=1 Tax=Hyphococcus luteus TaxID=2058213 RepID=A0A2S7K3G2_9PROT|nr:SDR family NAD(P)-dependent oxidoreductase [Marinicaulis flavus]PQA87042.1 acetoin dehydrogenase [Marinicaulis flavus]